MAPNRGLVKVIEKHYKSPKTSPPKGFHLYKLPKGTTTEGIKEMFQRTVPDMREGDLQVQTLRDERPENINVNVRVRYSLYRRILQNRKRLTLDPASHKPVEVRSI